MLELFAAVCFLGFVVAVVLALKWRREKALLSLILRLHKELTYILEPATSMVDVAPLLLDSLCRHANFQAACFFFADETGSMRCLSTWTSAGKYQAFCDASAKMIFGKGTGLPGLAEGAITVIDVADFSRDQTFRRSAEAEKSGLRSAVIVPVCLDSELLAVIELFSTEEHPRPELAETLTRIGQRAALLMQRENRQRHLTASESELRAVIDTAPDGIVYVDSTGIVESVNKAAIQLLGYQSDEMIGKDVVHFLPEVYKQKFGSALKYYFRTSVSGLLGRATEVVGQRKDGSHFPMELTVGRLMVGEREIFTGIIRDITDRKQMEKRVGEFYSTVSHELRSPLASIRGSLGLIEGGAMGDVSPEVIELIQIARKNCDRLIRLINDILDAKKIEAGKLQVGREILQPQDIIYSAIEGLQSFAAEAKVALIAHSSTSPAVIGDEDRIVQVLTNLLSNAIKYSPAGAHIDVATCGAINGEAFLRFCVSDHGPGIDSDQLAKLFSEFQQLDASDTRPKGGTGLGLAISKSIVEQMGGQIGVDNRPGEGATFWFELPLAQHSTALSEPAT